MGTERFIVVVQRVEKPQTSSIITLCVHLELVTVVFE